ncbi:outer membrane protein [Hyphobacterium sp.]|uniref:outer membrane protein n=1 Tax=Hyphobacterium sp. TaxID=2004662 RepID=UPI0037488DC3
MKFVALTTTTFILFSSTAAAQDNYVSGQFGIRAVEETDGSLQSGSIDLELANASYFSGVFGHQFDHVRIEGEISRRGGDFNALTINGTDVGAAGSGLAATGVMANILYDFRPEHEWTPYIGAGLGVARVTADFSGAGGTIDGDATPLAFQLIGGLSYDISSSATLFADLRYFRAQDTEFTLVAPLGTSTVTFQYDGYTLGAGLRFLF